MKLILIWLLTIGYSAAITFDVNTEWAQFKHDFPKVYRGNEEAIARNNFIKNKIFVDNHNNLANRGYYTYRVAINGFSDQSLLTFSQYFDEVVLDKSLLRPSAPITQAAIGSVDYADLGFESKLDGSTNLGCSAGWAFSAASVLEIFYSATGAATLPTGPLSVQQLIDCSGMGLGCTKQVPHMAFRYLENISLLPATSYPFQNQQGQCLATADPAAQSVTINDYATIQDGDSIQLKKVIDHASPVAFDFNPKSLQFMHYSSGIFVQPAGLKRGSHFMTITGYSPQFWKVKNSFGKSWGENGYIRISSSTLSIPKSAVYPIKI